VSIAGRIIHSRLFDPAGHAMWPPGPAGPGANRETQSKGEAEMATRLDHLLERIHPSRTLDRINAQTDAAMSSFSGFRMDIDTWQQFQDCMAAFYRHMLVNSLELRPPPDIDPDFAWGLCTRLLVAEYGARGPATAFDLARSGVEGGLYAVLKAVARRMAAEHAENLIGARVNDYLNGLSAEEELADAEEYEARYGHLLPPDMTGKGTVLLQAFFRQVLLQHPSLVQGLGRLGR
jgi:hypothetical protein